MSVNEVCRRSKISKPGLYREFGGEDGLLASVLELYAELVLSRITVLLESDRPVERVLASYAEGLIYQKGYPPGCLMVEMRMAREQLGPQTLGVLDRLTLELHEAMCRWVEAARQRGAMRTVVDSEGAASHLESQMMLVAIQAHRGGEAALIREQLELSLARYLTGPLWPEA